MVSFLYIKNVDLCTFPIEPSVELWPLLDFTTLAFQDNYILVIPYPEAESRLTAVIRPFNLTVYV